MKTITAVIFDMDGLLVDSEPIQFKASQILFQRLGHSFTMRHLQEFLGVRLSEELAKLKKRWELTQSIEQLARERRVIFLQLIREKLQLSKGALELLQFLKHSRISIGLGTSAQQWYVDEVMKKFKIITFFDATISSEQVKRGKPDPEVYLRVAARLGKSPSQCLVLEDAPNGISAAQAAGMTCFVVPSPFIPKAKFRQADQLFLSLHEVLLHLKNQNPNITSDKPRNLAKSVTVK